MTRLVKVHEVGRKGLEIREVELDEARRILRDATSWGSIVINAKNREIIWDIGPDIEEIEIVDMVGGG